MVLAVAGSQVASTRWDPGQTAVISAASRDRILVDAGPGTGKTAVACARLAHLIETGEVQASRAWMISFTRTAIAEIRARLEAYLGDEAAAVKVATVDAHAWTLHSGFDPGAALTGSYDQNIERVLQLVDGNEEAIDYLDQVEHLVVDEAQDLVGVRADLVEAIVGRLNRECGVTVFFDEAQAIYGFSEDEIAPARIRPSLVERLRSDDRYGFTCTPLDVVHRTSSAGLLSIFTDVRTGLLDSREPGSFSRVREDVARFADADGLGRSDLDIGSLRPGTLILFRTRSEALEASQFSEAPHSLRLSGYGASLPPWIAICFHDWTQPFMAEGEFGLRWTSRLGDAAPACNPGETWSRLIRLAGAGDSSLDLLQLRRRLSRRSGAAELAVPEFGLPGSVLGTIHASKGREADEVLLFLPRQDAFESDEAEREEARVLFVGASRARSTLRVGDGAKFAGRALPSGRAFRRLWSKGEAQRAMFEIGREHDLRAEGLVGAGECDQDQALASQTFLQSRATAISSFTLVREGADNAWNYRLVEVGGGETVGLMSPCLRDDLWAAAKMLGRDARVSPPSEVRHVRGLGCRTLVLDPDDPAVNRLHSPWSRSGFLLAPRLAAFPVVPFWRRGC